MLEITNFKAKLNLDIRILEGITQFQVATLPSKIRLTPLSIHKAEILKAIMQGIQAFLTKLNVPQGDKTFKLLLQVNTPSPIDPTITNLLLREWRPGKGNTPKKYVSIWQL